MLNEALAESELQYAMELVETSNPSFLETVRSKARVLAARDPNREICADVLRDWFDQNKDHMQLPRPTSTNVWGAVFKTEDWEFVRFTNSKQPQGHRNRVCVWRLKGDA